MATDASKLLTERDRAVLRLLADGMSNKRIASELHVSRKTIEGDLVRLWLKLGVPRSWAVGRSRSPGDR